MKTFTHPNTGDKYTTACCRCLREFTEKNPCWNDTGVIAVDAAGNFTALDESGATKYHSDGVCAVCDAFPWSAGVTIQRLDRNRVEVVAVETAGIAWSGSTDEFLRTNAGTIEARDLAYLFERGYTILDDRLPVESQILVRFALVE